MSLGFVVCLFDIAASEPNTLDEVVLSENFDSIVPGNLPNGWMQIDVDSGASPIFYNNPSVWQVLSRTGFPTHSGPCVVANGYNSDGSPNDDWLIMPLQTLTGTITLSYWVSSQDLANPETFQIRVSTGGHPPADFTHLIATISNAPRPWTYHTHNLSQFAGTPFYIAFHYISVDRFAIKIDDVILEGTGSPISEEAIDSRLAGFSFNGNYPNPFNAATTFSFSLGQPAQAKLILYSILGQEEASLLDKFVEAGVQKIAFDGSFLTSGLYFARFTAGGASTTRKVVILK